ncbi:MAG: histidinol dehydrogenase, partial [Pseudomonadales bacterium]|nr:histidinol dehydrogenase [Pseudomonadales bacterium]
MTLTIRKLKASDPNFAAALDAALSWDALADATVEERVRAIIADVRARGDAAVLEWTNRFDKLAATDASALRIAPERLQQSLQALPGQQAAALRTAAERIRRYHEKQKQASWQYQEADGSVFGQKITPLDRVGMYVPGGKASYPSTVLMDAIPAR